MTHVLCRHLYLQISILRSDYEGVGKLLVASILYESGGIRQTTVHHVNVVAHFHTIKLTDLYLIVVNFLCPSAQRH